jgi:hypothetical protein
MEGFFMRDEYLEALENRLWQRYGELGAVPRYDSERVLMYSPKYLAKLDCLGQGPEKIKRGNRVFYPIPGLIKWLKARTT